MSLKLSTSWAKPVTVMSFAVANLFNPAFAADTSNLLNGFAANRPVPIATAKPVAVDLLPQPASIAPVTSTVRGAAGASFIKLHFDYFNLPAGAVLEVADASGKEVYRYSSAKFGPHTVEAALDEDGKTRFGAMSVNGEVAHLRLLLNGAKWDPAVHGVRVRRVMEGFPDYQIRDILRQQQRDANGNLSTCGVNERKDAVCFASSNPAEYERSRPVARLVLNGGLCTTWRVGSGNFMMTNNHCIASQSEASGAEVWFNYQYTNCNGTTLAPVTKVNAVTMLKTDATLDYTLYTISDLAAIASFGNFGLDVRTPIKDEQIFIPQHGEGNPKELAITSDQNTGGVCRIDAPVQNGNGSNTDAGYRCDTIGGSSGSPVVATSSKKVIALHHLGGCPSTTNSGALISLIWPQIASYFNNVIPAGDSSTPPPPVATPLSANVAKTGLAGDLGSEAFYVLDLPVAPTTLKFATSAGSGDLDLYVKYGSMPGTSVADCKAETVGNAETCNIATPAAGKYYVLLKGHAAYSGASLLASVTTPGGPSYQNSTVFSIPDNNSSGISSPVTVPRTGASGTVSVDVDISHTYIGDLVVSLIAPNGKVFTLHNKAGGSADNIVKTYSVNAGTVASNGVWKLRVVDAASVDIGKLNNWKLTFAN